MKQKAIRPIPVNISAPIELSMAVMACLNLFPSRRSDKRRRYGCAVGQHAMRPLGSKGGFSLWTCHQNPFAVAVRSTPPPSAIKTLP